MKLIVGNWKMYPKDLPRAKGIVTGLRPHVRAASRSKVVLCPPAPFLSGVAQMLGKGAALLGAQNCASADEGAMTGEYSPTMLLSVGAKFVILGHSERRAMGETSEEVAVKAARALGHNLQVIICVGEKERDAESGFYREVKEQLEASLRGVPTKYGRRVVVAYEPIWAIGEKAKRAATTEDFREMRVLLRNVLVDHFGRSAGFAVPILYGGSVDEKNAEGFLRQGEADGLLVGRASLDPARFGAILRIASAIH